MSGILLDVDGVLHISGHPILGGAKATARLREAGHQLRFVTNNTTRTRAELADDVLRRGELPGAVDAAGLPMQSARVRDEDGRKLIDVLVDPNEGPAVPEQMELSETQDEMMKLLAGLKPIEADILRKRFGLTSDREQDEPGPVVEHTLAFDQRRQPPRRAGHHQP